jgi:acyl-CoA thioester hydrolase
MPRIKIEINNPIIFQCQVPVRITDINYGNHVGNDSLLSIIHETRQQFFNYLGGSELNLFGFSVIMSDVAIVFKKEIFYPSTLVCQLTISDFGSSGFDVNYKINVLQDNNELTIAAVAKTGMVCFNYDLRKIMSVPTSFTEHITTLQANANG